MSAASSGGDFRHALLQRARWLLYRIHFDESLGTILEYAKLMRLDRPVGIWLLLWPTLWALWIASAGKPAPAIFTIFILGVVLMRSAGCVINDFADRKIDPNVRRTRERPLAAQRVSTAEALVLFLILVLSAFFLVIHLNRLTLLLSVLGAALTVSYPFLKRFFSLPQFYLGLAFGWGIPMAFAAQSNQVPRVAWLLFIANILWCAVYDTIYAMVDRDDDRRIGVRSTAILFGDSDRHLIAIMQAMTLLALYLAGSAASLGHWYAAGLAAGGIFFVHHLALIRRRDPEDCFKAFLNNHYFGMAVFVGIALDYLFR